MKFRPINYINVVLAVIFLTACATPYTPPESGETASLTLSDNTRMASFYYNIDTRSCPKTKSFLMGHFPETSLLYAKDMKIVSKVENIKIRANEKFSFSLSAGGANGPRCVMMGSFMPEKDKQYEFFFRTAGDVCILNINNLTTTTAGELVKTPEPSFKRSYAEFVQGLC